MFDFISFIKSFFKQPLIYQPEVIVTPVKVVFHGPKRSYVFTEEDFLWSCRMIVGETLKATREETNYIMWAMINRFLLHIKQDGWPTFTDLIRRFSQPINPEWIGKFCQPGGKGYNTEACSAKRIEKRKNIHAMSIEEIPESIRLNVRDVFDGKSILKSRVCNWRATDEETKKKYPNGIDIGGNWFFEEKSVLLPEGIFIKEENYV
jgi:hypothetical protein